MSKEIKKKPVKLSKTYKSTEENANKLKQYLCKKIKQEN